MTSLSVLRDGEPASALMGALQDLCVELNQRAAVARMETSRICGEFEVRLQVMLLGSPVVVEVLGPWSGLPTGECWDAVRIDPWSRVVWRGPAHCCSAGELLRFVEALLRRDVDGAAQTYLPLE